MVLHGLITTSANSFVFKESMQRPNLILWKASSWRANWAIVTRCQSCSSISVYSQVGLKEIGDAYVSLRAALQLNIENDSVSWVIFSLAGYANILVAEGKRESALEILGLCINHPETNSDTQRDIQLVLEDLKKVRSDDIEAGLERGKLLDINKTVLMALGG